MKASAVIQEKNHFLGDKMHFYDAPRFKSAFFLISLALLLISNIKTGHSEDKIHEEQI